MPKFIDRTGVRFSRLVALHYEGNQRWRCRCDCGAELLVRIGALTTGNTRSCGCLAREILLARSTKHGQASRKSHTNLYRRWEHMKQRCSNPRDRDYPRYGAKGITVCDRWVRGDGTRSGFECFLADMGPPPNRAYSIDRIDVLGPYAPDNCRWATSTQQANNRRNTIYIEVDGVVKPCAEWCRQYGISKQTLRYRINVRGMTPRDAVTTPVSRAQP